MTVWQSNSAIDAFAGPDREAAVVAPEAQPCSPIYGPRVRHFEVAHDRRSLLSANSRSSSQIQETFRPGTSFLG